MEMGKSQINEIYAAGKISQLFSYVFFMGRVPCRASGDVLPRCWCVGAVQLFQRGDGMLAQERLAEVLPRQQHASLSAQLKKRLIFGFHPLPWQLLSILREVTVGGEELQQPRLLYIMK